MTPRRGVESRFDLLGISYMPPVKELHLRQSVVDPSPGTRENSIGDYEIINFKKERMPEILFAVLSVVPEVFGCWFVEGFVHCRVSFKP